MWNPKKEAEKAAKKVVDKIVKPAADAAKGSVNWVKEEAKKSVRKVGSEVEKSAKKVGSEVENGVKGVAREAEDGIRKAGKEVEDTFEKRIPELVTEKLPEALEALAKEAAKDSVKKALNVALDVVETMAPSSYTLTFGVELALVVQGEVTISATIPNPVAKLTEIRKWASRPPSGRAKIIECVKDFGPSSVSGEFKISGNGGSAEWSGDDKYDRIDAFLKNRGVS